MFSTIHMDIQKDHKYLFTPQCKVSSQTKKKKNKRCQWRERAGSEMRGHKAMGETSS